jgi:hypothetical protein
LLASEREEANGQLGVRLSNHPERGLAGILAADELLQTLGSGAVPDEMLALARESLAADPNLVDRRSSSSPTSVAPARPASFSPQVRARAVACAPRRPLFKAAPLVPCHPAPPPDLSSRRVRASSDLVRPRQAHVP